MSTIDGPKVDQLRRDIELALQDVVLKHGLVVKLGSGSYTSNNVTFKLSVSVVRDDGMVMSKEAEDLKRFKDRYGIKPSALGVEFEYEGKTFRVIGAKPRSRRYPILTEDVKSGKKTRFPFSVVKRLLPAEHVSDAPYMNSTVLDQIAKEMDGD